jgi:hypothetical protein
MRFAFGFPLCSFVSSVVKGFWLWLCYAAASVVSFGFAFGYGYFGFAFSAFISVISGKRL